MPKKHILIFNWKDLRHPKRGGAELLTHEVAKRLVTKGYHVSLIAASFPHAKVHEEIEGVDVYRCGNRFTVYFQAYRLYKKMFRGRVDTVIDQINTIPFLTPWYVNERVVGFIHQMAKRVWFYEMPFPLSLIGFLLEPLYLKVYKRVPMLTVSESTKADLLHVGILEKNISIISEGLALPPLESLDHAKKEAIPTFLYLGSLRPMKRVMDVLDAFRMIYEVNSKTQLWIAGGGERGYLAKLRRYVEKNNLSDVVTFFGPVSQEEKQALLGRAHLLLVTSVLEGWGLVVTEANSQGTPAVVYDVGGLRDSTQHNVTGVVCQENPRALAEAVRRILANPIEYERLMKNAWEWSKTFNWDVSAKQFERMLQPAVSSQPSAFSKPLVSVIIPSFNAEQWIEKTLQSLREQTYNNIEIIVVDNFSTDRTTQIAQKYSAQVLVHGTERAAQVNYGVAHAQGKYIYRVDADFVVEPEVIAECVATCEAQSLEGIAVHNTSDPTVSFWSAVRNLERNCYQDDDVNIGLRFVSKPAFEKLGGFDEHLIAGEDYDFHNRFVKAGFTFGRIAAKEVHLAEPKTLREVMAKSYFYGKSLPEYVKKHPGKSIQQLNPLRTAYFRHWKRLLRHPILTAGLLIYTIAKYSSGGIGYLVNLGAKTISSPLRGEDKGGGELGVTLPLPPPLKGGEDQHSLTRNLPI